MSESLAGLRRSMMCGEVGLTQVDTEVTLMGYSVGVTMVV